MPVLQGWGVADYWRHAEDFARAGVDLAALPRVGVGSVCRRQGTVGVAVILGTLAVSRLRLHAFGLKMQGLLRAAGSVVSADSLAWSYRARHAPPLPECRGEHERCNNCLRFALRWRRKLLDAVGLDDPHREEPPVQPTLW